MSEPTAVYFKVEIQTFLAYFLRNVKSLQLIGCESLKPSDFLNIKKTLPNITKKYDKQDHQGKAAFNERSPHPTQ
jgi:hypothetical protein